MTETLIALPANEYELLEQAYKENAECKRAYEAQVKLALEKAVIFEQMRRREESLRLMLSQACDEMEGIFNTTGKLASPQIATDYCVWARYLEVHYGRTNHVAYEVNEWLEKL